MRPALWTLFGSGLHFYKISEHCLKGAVYEKTGFECSEVCPIKLNAAKELKIASEFNDQNSFWYRKWKEIFFLSVIRRYPSWRIRICRNFDLYDSLCNKWNPAITVSICFFRCQSGNFICKSFTYDMHTLAVCTYIVSFRYPPESNEKLYSAVFKKKAGDNTGQSITNAIYSRCCLWIKGFYPNKAVAVYVLSGAIYVLWFQQDGISCLSGLYFYDGSICCNWIFCVCKV